MPPRRLRRIDAPVRLAGIGLASLCWLVMVPAAEPAKPSAAATEVRGVAQEFERAKSVADRGPLVDRMLALGVEGARRLQATCRGEIRERSARYATAFERAAMAVLADRHGKADRSGDIEGLRRAIRDVAAASDLSKEMIRQTSDPALARLETLLLVDPQKVLAANPALAADRDMLLSLAAWGERAASLLPPKDRARLGDLPDRAAASAQCDATESLAVLLALPLTPADRATLAGNAAVAGQLDPEEARGMQRLNQIRILVGLPAQAVDLALVKACRIHSQDMTTRGFFAHESPVSGRETPWKRAQSAGTSANAENIAGGVTTGAAAIDMWWHSPGHHKNMLGGHRRTGLGRHEKHWTQLFG